MLKEHSAERPYPDSAPSSRGRGIYFSGVKRIPTVCWKFSMTDIF
jgi:hypothetical protein